LHRSSLGIVPVVISVSSMHILYPVDTSLSSPVFAA
jgi:hypothetical protein